MKEGRNEQKKEMKGKTKEKITKEQNKRNE